MRYVLVIFGVMVLSGCFKNEPPKPGAAEITDPPSVPAQLPDVPPGPAIHTMETDKPGQTLDSGTSGRVQTPALRETARQQAMKELEKIRSQGAPKNNP